MEVQKELKLQKPFNTRQFHEAFHHFDKEGSGFLDKAKFLNVCDRFNVPTSTILLKKVRWKGCCACGIPLLWLFQKISSKNQL